jgi:aldehyde:ferredoxin oxidoreductase
MYGYAGAILRINLTNKKISKQYCKKSWQRMFLGGSGINDWILYNEVEPHVSPLDPQNRLIFGVGPLAGTIFPAGSKIKITTRSPLTGMLGDAASGGTWGVQLKHAGYDHIVVSGKSEKPVYIWIDDDNVEILDANLIWGKDVFETNDIIKRDLGDQEISVAAIGQAGENMVKFASIIIDRYRAAGRTGVGCVMGSKNLKAIAVRGYKAIRIADPMKFEKYCQIARERLDPRRNPLLKTLSKYGTIGLLPVYHEIGCLSVKNFQDVSWDKIDSFDVEEVFLKKFVKRSLACSPNCLIHCSHWWQIKEGRFAGEEGEKPELVISISFGPNLDNADMASILYIQNLINKYGVDSIETATAIGLLMECWQKGIISEKDTGGTRYEWGDVEVIIETIKKIVYREGIGNLLAEGTLNAAKKLGCENFVCHAKGMTMIEDVRAFPHWALNYAVSTRGADHLKGYSMIDKSGRTDISEALFGDPGAGIAQSPRLKGVAVKFFEEFLQMCDALGICKLIATRLLIPADPKDILGLEYFSQVFSSATGIEISSKEFAKSCERIVVLEKMFNTRLGVRRKDDILGYRWMKEPCPSGPGKGMKAEDYLETCLDEYYEARRFDLKMGIPTKTKLKELELENLIGDLEKTAKLDVKSELK